MTYDVKYELERPYWVMWNNIPCQFYVHSIDIRYITKGCKKEVAITYFMSSCLVPAILLDFTQDKIFHTKEELLASL